MLQIINRRARKPAISAQPDGALRIAPFAFVVLAAALSWVAGWVLWQVTH